MVYVSGEVGVGGSVISDGVRLAGRAGLAGEFGHVLVNPAGHRCSCGAIGCWETEIGERALLRRAGLDADGGVSAVDELFTRAAAGESTALDALDAEGRWLGMGIAGLINVFDPDVVVLGALLERVLPHARDALDAELADRRIHGLERSVDGRRRARSATMRRSWVLPSWRSGPCSRIRPALHELDFARREAAHLGLHLSTSTTNLEVERPGV